MSPILRDLTIKKLCDEGRPLIAARVLMKLTFRKPSNGNDGKTKKEFMQRLHKIESMHAYHGGDLRYEGDGNAQLHSRRSSSKCNPFTVTTLDVPATSK